MKLKSNEIKKQFSLRYMYIDSNQTCLDLSALAIVFSADQQ